MICAFFVPQVMFSYTYILSLICFSLATKHNRSLHVNHSWSMSEKSGEAYKEIRLKWHDKIDYQCGSGLVSSYQAGRQLTIAPGLVARFCYPIRHARRAIQLKNTVKLAQMKSLDVALWPQPTKVTIQRYVRAPSAET